MGDTRDIVNHAPAAAAWLAGKTVAPGGVTAGGPQGRMEFTLAFTDGTALAVRFDEWWGIDLTGTHPDGSTAALGGFEV